MARTGKIARQPWDIRNQLNQRLQENEPSEKILEWLNANWGVRDVLRLHFDGRPITDVNLTAWRNGGFKDWLEDQRALEQVERLADQAHGAEKAAEGPLSEHLAVLLTMRLASLMQKLLAEADNNPPDKQWQYAKELSRELDRLRRSDHRCRQLRIQEERWEWERDRQDRQDEAQADDDDRKKKADKVKAAARMPIVAQYYGTVTKSHEFGKNIAQLLFAIEHDGPPPNDEHLTEKVVAELEAAAKAQADQPKGKGPASKAKKTPPKKKTKTRPGKAKRSNKADSQKSSVSPKQEDAAGDAPEADAEPPESETPGWNAIPSAEPEDGAGEDETADGDDSAGEPPL